MSETAPNGAEPPVRDAPQDPRDLAPVIEALMCAASSAVALNSAAAMQAARDLLVAAAELKQRLPARPATRSDANTELTMEEWQKRFKPRG